MPGPMLAVDVALLFEHLRVVRQVLTAVLAARDGPEGRASHAGARLPGVPVDTDWDLVVIVDESNLTRAEGLAEPARQLPQDVARTPGLRPHFQGLSGFPKDILLMQLLDFCP